jgi:hypothetical protein
VIFETETTSEHGTETLTATPIVTEFGSHVTEYTGKTSNGSPVTFTTNPTYSVPIGCIPKSASYQTPTGGHVTYSYIPTSHGFETVTKSTVPTKSGDITYVDTVTSNGASQKYTITEDTKLNHG